MSDKIPSQKSSHINPLAASDEHIEQALAPWQQYIIAVILPLTALVLVTTSPLFETGVYLPFYVAIGVVAWYCGLLPALVSTLLSIVAVEVLVLGPRNEFAFNLTDVIRMATLLLISILINIPNIRRRRAEELIRQQREWFRVTLDSIGDAVIATDTEQNITFINPMASKLCGWTEADALGRSITDVFRVINEDTHQPVRNPVEQVLREGRIVVLANHSVLIRPDGDNTPIDDSGAPIRNTAGDIIGAVLVFRDISERKRAENRTAVLHRITEAFTEAITPEEVAERFMRQGVEVMGVQTGAVFLLNKDKTSLDVVSQYNLHPDVLDSRGSIALTTPTASTDAARTGESIWIPDKRSYRERYPNLANQMADRMPEAAMALPLVVNGQRIGVLGVGFNTAQTFEPEERSFWMAITRQVAQALERARLFRETAEAREWFEVTLGSIGDAVIATDTEQKITFINPVAAELCGWTEADALGRPIMEVFRIVNEDTRQTVENPVEKVLREGKVVGLANHTILIRPDGFETSIDDSGAPIRNPKGDLIGTVLVFRDISERKVTEKQLRESEERFRTMAETVPGILFTTLPNREIDYVSQKVTEYTGMSVEDALGRGYMSLLHPDDIARGQEAMPQSESTGSFAVEHRIRTTDGRYRWFFTRMRALFDDKGQIIKWVGKSTDIHDMKVAQEELTRLNKLLDQERARLSSILSTVPGVVWEAWGEPDESSQRINFVSDYVETMLGYTVDEWVSTSNFWLNIVHPDDKERAGSDSRKIFESGKPGINRFRWVTKDGRAIPVEAQSMTIFDDEGNPVGMRGVTMDISERAEAERERTLLIRAQQVAIREKDEALALLDALFFSAPVGLAFFDRDIRYQRINQALADMNGLSPEAHIGRTPRELLPDVAVEGTETMFQQVLESGRMVIFETSGRTLAASGDEINYWLASYYPIRLGDELLGIGALVMDITDRKRIEQQKTNVLERERAARKAAEEADRLKLTFLAMISHELRTPLTSIKGFATTLLADDITWDAESQRDFIAIISEESDKLTDLIEQLLDLSRLEAGTMSITPEPMQLSEIVSTAMAQLETITVNHTLIIDVAADLPPVMADVRRTGQIIANLVNNAAKYTPTGTNIRIRAVQDDGFLLMSIADDGPGIPPAERVFVFEAFRQVESKGSNYKKGAGLGLAICKGLTEAHGGRIWIEDTASGTTICFTLPIAKED